MKVVFFIRIQPKFKRVKLASLLSYHAKVFRLFISSTFNDFKAERALLQTEVFPELKQYCNAHKLFKGRVRVYM